MSQEKTKVAILGGGVGSMVTAFELTQPHVRDRFDVTIYQMGWRLGGKGASGRNADFGQRIEEHGPHVWSGLYDNAFRVIRAVYEELDRPPEAPLATWREAFQPLGGTMSLMEEFDGDWTWWTLEPPSNDQLPGEEDAHLMLPVWSYVGEALQVVRRWFRDSQRAKHAYHASSHESLRRILSSITHPIVIGLIEVTGVVLSILFPVAAWAYRLLAGLLRTVGLSVVMRAAQWCAAVLVGLLIGALHLITRVQWLRVRAHIHDVGVRKHWIFLNFAVGLMRGLSRDRVFQRGFDSLDDVEFREWLGRHIVQDLSPAARVVDPADAGSARSLTLSSPLAFFLYDADFAYENGDLTKPRISAGVALLTMVRLGLTWKGSVIWEMHAGMGDVIFGPAYEVLKRRGVRFEFFHKVKDLHVSEDGRRISSITVAKQARVTAGSDAYEPLEMVQDLPCWPSEPLWQQLDGGEALRAAGADFESWYGPEVETCELLHGRDYDQVLLGISLGGIPYVCGELIEARPTWKAMVDEIGTVATQALQLWLDLTSQASGWDQEGNPTVSCYDASAFTGWMDMSFLLSREDWPEGPDRPQAIQYIVGAMHDDDPRGRIQSPEELDRDKAKSRVREQSLTYMKRQIFRITSNIASDGTFEWRRLVDPNGAQGEARLDAQYIRANVALTERYVLSLPGTTRYRLHPADSGFDNLYLAGDWTWSNLNVGCVEGATVSAMLAAHGICGSPPLERIVGLNFGHPNSRYAQRGRER